MRAKGKKEGSINVVLHTVMVCKLQGWKEPAVIREWSGDSRKSKMLKGEAWSQGNPLEEVVMRIKASNDFRRIKAK